MKKTMTPNFWPEKGHFNLDQYNFIATLLEKREIKYVLETGFCTGRSALAVLNNCPDLEKMISIDIDFDYGGMNGRKMVETLQENFSSFSAIESNSQKKLTKSFFKTNYPNGIDYALVDGDHSYDGCSFDLNKIVPHVNSGGLILIDDYKSGPPNGYSIPVVTQACDDFYEKNSGIVDREEWNKDGKGFCIFTKK
jgi:predicted O-methyltransferase YrrM